MATEVRWRRGTTAENDNFTGAEGEITVDMDKKGLRVHDNATQGGHPSLTEEAAHEAGYAYQVDSVSDLQTGSFPASLKRLWLAGYYGVDTAGGGPLYRDSDDTTTADNGGTVFVDSDGVRWKRNKSTSYSLTDFGVREDVDSLAEAQSAIDTAIAEDFLIKQDYPITVSISSALVATGSEDQRLRMELDKDVKFVLTDEDTAVLRTYDFDTLSITGGTFDSNDQITSDFSYVIGAQVPHDDIEFLPRKVTLKDVTAIGPAGEDFSEESDNSTRGIITFRGPVRDGVAADYLVEECNLDNVQKTRGSCMVLMPGGEYENGHRALIRNNKIRNTWGGIRCRNIKYTYVKDNTIVNIAQRGIRIYGTFATDRPVLEDDIVTVTGNSVKHDTVDHTDPTGIIFGLNAGVVFCTNNICESRDSDKGTGINSDVVLHSHKDDRDVRPSSLIENNTVNGYNWGYFSNDSFVVFRGNRSLDPGEYAFHSSAGSEKSIYYTNNYCQGENAKIAFRPSETDGDSVGRFLSPIMGENVFVGVKGPHVVRSKNDGLLIASRPTTVSDDFIQSASYGGVHADIYELDTSAGSISTWLPSAGIIPAGTRLRVYIKKGANSVTLYPRNRSFSDDDVDTTENTIDLSWVRKQDRILGAPVRFGGSGDLPEPLEKGRVYYVIPGEEKGLAEEKFLFAETEDDAINLNEIDLESTGTGTNTFFDLLFEKDGTVLDDVVINSQTEMLDLVSGAACWWVIDKDEIVESDTNDNGSYVRWANGEQVCRVQLLTLDDVGISDGKTRMRGEWTFPASFVSAEQSGSITQNGSAPDGVNERDSGGTRFFEDLPRTSNSLIDHFWDGEVSEGESETVSVTLWGFWK